MPRPRLCRRIGFVPNINYFRPAGIRLTTLEDSVLTMGELEAVRLKDLLGIEQSKAAKKMNISQPTFHRLLVSARKKIADALVNGKAIRIEGGNFRMAQATRPGIRRGMGRGFRGGMGPSGECICSKCGYKEPKQRGVPCVNKKCPKCNNVMIRG